MRSLAFALALLPALSFGWGFDGHRRLASMMQDPLPANHCLRQFFAANQSFARQNRSCDADRARYATCDLPDGGSCYDPDEAPRHYLELDWVQPPACYPRLWSSAMAQLGQFAVEDGQVPWRVEEQYELLVAAFASGDAEQILDRAFFFSHYVTDSFSVMHNTRYYDTPSGIHSRWESDMLANSSRINGVAAGAVGYYGTPGLADPRNNIFDIIIVGNTLVPTLVAADRATRDGGFEDMSAFYALVQDLTSRRWGDALTVLASILWSAWAEAGAPSLPNTSPGCLVTVPTGEIVLRGYPVPGGFTHFPGDACTDGGVGGGSGGGTATGGGAGGGASGGGSAGGGSAGGGSSGGGSAGGGSAGGGSAGGGSAGGGSAGGGSAGGGSAGGGSAGGGSAGGGSAGGGSAGGGSAGGGSAGGGGGGGSAGGAGGGGVPYTGGGLAGGMGGGGEDGRGCGCDAGGSAGAFGGLALLGLAALRRRRR